MDTENPRRKEGETNHNHFDNEYTGLERVVSTPEDWGQLVR